jgi:hypothetical protein
MKRYLSFNIVADGGQVNEDYHDYRAAYSAYCKEIRYGHPATLYGRTIEGDIRIIFSKG